MKKKEYELLKQEHKQIEELKIKENDNILDNKKNQKNIEIERLKNELEQLKLDISYLEKEIQILKEKNEGEIRRRKEEILNHLQHEYEIKIYKYEKEKELEQIKKEDEIKYIKKEFEAKKELEFTDLRYKADTVNKLIFILSQN